MTSKTKEPEKKPEPPQSHGEAAQRLANKAKHSERVSHGGGKPQ